MEELFSKPLYKIGSSSSTVSTASIVSTTRTYLTGRTRLECSPDERESRHPWMFFISLESIGSRPGRHATNEANGGLTWVGLCDDDRDWSDRGARFCRRSPACTVRHIGICSHVYFLRRFSTSRAFIWVGDATSSRPSSCWSMICMMYDEWAAMDLWTLLWVVELSWVELNLI